MKQAPEGGRLHGGRAAQRCRRDDGVAFVEFAILLPFLAVVAFGLVDLTRAYSLKNRLKNAAREGAAYVQTHPLKQADSGPSACNDPDNARWHALNELDAAGESAGDPTFTVIFSPSTACNVATTQLEPGDKVTVTVEADFELLTPLISNLVGSPIGLEESVEVVIQG
jgi:Flp pilus assembly protein TadG